MVPYCDYPEDVKESIRKAELRMKMLKEEERRNFPFKKKGFRKHIR
jgi:hypothetical protein